MSMLNSIEWLRDISIKQKMMLIVMVTCGISLLLACLAFIIYDRVTFRERMTYDLKILAEIVGENCAAALVFDDRNDAREVLSALEAEHCIISACVNTNDGEIFAEYSRGGSEHENLFQFHQEDEVYYEDDYMELYQSIVLEGEKIGTIYIRSDMHELEERLSRYAVMVFVVMSLTGLVTLFVISKLQRIVSEPIVHLTQVAREVSARKDYSLRATQYRRDEFGFLITRFNEMLTQIQERDAALREAYDVLEERVKERTKELENEIIERKQAEEALRASEEKYRQLVENLTDVLIIGDPEDRLLFVNPAAKEVFGLPPNELVGHSLGEFLDPEQFGIVRQQTARRRQGKKDTYEVTICRHDGEKRQIRVSASPQFDLDGDYVGSIGLFTDITNLRELENQLRESQKMEAIGTLAGGVAHDFNNLLTAMIGHLDLALASIDPDDPTRADLEEVQKAGARAASLTQQLLAYGRRQTLEPKILDLNIIISNMDKMLRRIIGEDIDLVTKTSKDLWMVKADPGQIEQVIVNLAANARDAMPTGGKLSIETSNAELDIEYAEAHVAIPPGLYVMLAVSDTGTGMTEDIKSRIFDPFFTTKEVGKGTGLGLSTVYGIVKQSGGNIWVYSEPGRGTTFKIYLPKVEGIANSFTAKPVSSEAPRGDETILVVEDEDTVRDLTVRILEKKGYKVLKASTGKEACELCWRMERPVDLVITDVIMPEMGGAELAKQLKGLWSDLKVLYMSGYTANAIAHHGVLDSDKAYLQKPFRSATLAQKVRDVLDG